MTKRRKSARAAVVVAVLALVSGTVCALPAAAQQADWSVNPNEFAGSMSVTSVLVYSGDGVVSEGDRVGAFVNGQARGVASPVEVGNRWFFFLTVFGQADGERVSFRYYREDGDAVHRVFETTTFMTDRILGTTTAPFLLTANVSTGVRAEVQTLAALGASYPEPFSGATTIPYAVATAGDVRLEVYNVLGQRVATVVDETQSAGSYEAEFDAATLPVGIYFYRLSLPSGTTARSMTLAR